MIVKDIVDEYEKRKGKLRYYEQAFITGDDYLKVKKSYYDYLKRKVNMKQVI